MLPRRAEVQAITPGKSSDATSVLSCSPHEPLRGCAVRPVEGLSDEDVECGAVDRRVQEGLRDETRKRGERHVQAVQQVWNDEVPELEQLLGDRGGQEAC